MDTLEDQKAFAEKIGGIRFPLVADPEAEIAESYGALMEGAKIASRRTVVIGQDGTVLRTYPDAPLDGKGHAEQVLNDLKGLIGSA